MNKKAQMKGHILNHKYMTFFAARLPQKVLYIISLHHIHAYVSYNKCNGNVYVRCALTFKQKLVLRFNVEKAHML